MGARVRNQFANVSSDFGWGKLSGDFTENILMRLENYGALVDLGHLLLMRLELELVTIPAAAASPRIRPETRYSWYPNFGIARL